MIYAYNDNHLIHNIMAPQEDCIGTLPDAISCEIERNTDGLFSLTMKYPRTGRNEESLQLGNWIYADAGGDLGMQFFEIVEIEREDPGEIYVQANHASYNAHGILAMPFTAESSKVNHELDPDVNFYAWNGKLEEAVNKISAVQWGWQNSEGLTGLSIVGYTDDMTLNAARYTEPVTVYQAVLDAIKDREEILLLADNLNLKLWKVFWDAAPSFEVRYGRDMKNFHQAASSDDLYTAIFPYAIRESGAIVTDNNQRFHLTGLPEKYKTVFRTRPLNIDGLYGFDVKTSDMGAFRTVVQMWLNANPFRVPAIETSVGALENKRNHFELGLVGTIYYTPWDIKVKTSITAMTYDVLNRRVTAISVGGVQKDIVARISDLSRREH